MHFTKTRTACKYISVNKAGYNCYPTGGGLGRIPAFLLQQAKKKACRRNPHSTTPNRWRQRVGEPFGSVGVDQGRFHNNNNNNKRTTSSGLGRRRRVFGVEFATNRRGGAFEGAPFTALGEGDGGIGIVCCSAQGSSSGFECTPALGKLTKWCNLLWARLKFMSCFYILLLLFRFGTHFQDQSPVKSNLALELHSRRCRG